ncbi:DUF4126 domain-containing protein [Corynebacterium phoceense]
MELSAALGLATSAGLNAYIPLLIYGVLARYTDWVNLPEGWTWLSDPILLIIIGVLLAVSGHEKVTGGGHEKVRLWP